MSVLLLQIKGPLNRWLGVRKDHYMILLHTANGTALYHPLSVVHAVLWTIKKVNRVENRSLCMHAHIPIPSILVGIAVAHCSQ